MSKKYIYEAKESGNTNLQKEFIEIINKWANKIPHHPYRNLGNKIKVTDIWYKPAYPIQVRSQYEVRSKNEDFEPFTNQTIPPRNYYQLSDFNSWDFNYNEVENFTNKVTKYYVDGSQHVEDCFKCNARGWITCVTCHGNQKVTCPKCRGKGNVQCSSCGGHGRKNCGSCGGHGYHNRTITKTKQIWVPDSGNASGGYYRTESYNQTIRETCNNCNGSGKVKCRNCGGSGRVTCKRCSGSGQITCPTCGGSGRNICPTCKGHTQLMHYFYVERDLHFLDKENCVIHSEVFNRFPQFLDEYQNYQSYNIHSFRAQKLDHNQLEEGVHLNKFINDFIQEGQSPESDTNTLLYQQLDISCIDTWELHYEFKGKPYVMVFHGSDYEIIPGLSPIYEISFKYWKSGIASAKFYMYDQSRKMLKKAAAMNSYEIKQKVDVSLNSVKTKMAEPLNLGARMAAYIIAFIGGFLAFNYFNEVNYVFNYIDFINNPDNFLNPYHAWGQTIVFVSLSFAAAKTTKSLFSKLSAYVPFALVRFSLGVLATLLFASIYFGLLALANAVGIGILITLLLWGILKILQLIVILVYLIVKVILWIWHLIF